MMRRLSVSNTVLLIICIRLCTNAGRYSHVAYWQILLQKSVETRREA
jgi:hypothetical protein